MRKCEIIANITELKNRYCLISQRDLEEEFENNTTIIKLSCGHCFLYYEFMKSFIINNKNIYSYYKCPYCNSDILKPPIIVKKHIL